MQYIVECMTGKPNSGKIQEFGVLGQNDVVSVFAITVELCTQAGHLCQIWLTYVRSR